MFNELCRVACVEDLLQSEELIGEDLSDLAPYFEMAYLGEGGQHGSWFWLEEEAGDLVERGKRVERGGAVGKWVWISSDDGLRQGAPLSCVLAAQTWSSMTWGGHWRQRIGVEIARGVARCVEKAATGGWVGSGSSHGHSHEYDRDCC